MAENNTLSKEHLVDAFLLAKNYVRQSGFSDEILWQSHNDFSSLSEQVFLQESAWVVLSSGMAEKVIRKCFTKVSSAFRMWKSAEEIVVNDDICREQAFAIFGHAGKIHAISEIAKRVHRLGFIRVKKEIAANGIDFLQTLPYMGPATSLHLAKNIGLNVAKPDRHLCRIAKSAGYSSPKELCETISLFVEDSIKVIDIVLWRYATLDPQYSKLFSIPSATNSALQLQEFHGEFQIGRGKSQGRITTMSNA